MSTRFSRVRREKGSERHRRTRAFTFDFSIISGHVTLCRTIVILLFRALRYRQSDNSSTATWYYGVIALRIINATSSENRSPRRCQNAKKIILRVAFETRKNKDCRFRTIFPRKRIRFLSRVVVWPRIFLNGSTKTGP